MYLHNLLSTVSPYERSELIRHIKLRSFRRNEVVLNPDEETQCIYCVASGLLRVVVSGRSGREDVTTDFIKRDEFFLASAFDETRRAARTSLIATLPSTVHVVPWQQFYGLCSKHPEILLALFKLGLKRKAMLRKQLRRVSCSASEALIGRALHELTQLAPAGVSGYDKRITQAVIASYTGLSREQVNKTMRDFEQRGLLKKDKHGVHIPSDFACSDYQSPGDTSESMAESVDQPPDVDSPWSSELLGDFDEPKDSPPDADPD